MLHAGSHVVFFCGACLQSWSWSFIGLLWTLVWSIGQEAAGLFEKPSQMLILTAMGSLIIMSSARRLRWSHFLDCSVCVWKSTQTNAKSRHSMSLWTRKSAANCSFVLAQMKEVTSSTTIFEEQLRKQAPLGSQRSRINNNAAVFRSFSSCLLSVCKQNNSWVIVPSCAELIKLKYRQCPSPFCPLWSLLCAGIVQPKKHVEVGRWLIWFSLFLMDNCIPP